MRRSTREIGQTGEWEAERFLRGKGYRILERNLRSRTGELDLVADDRGVLVFVEVKARGSVAFGGAIHAVDERKQLRVVRQAARYLSSCREPNRPCRFDVILVESSGSAGLVLEHIPDAFQVPADDLRW
jgi:putative endonuclease